MTKAIGQTVRVSGLVLDDESGKVMNGVPVFLLGSKSYDVTKEGEGFIFPKVAPGSYLLSVAQKGYAQTQDSLVVAGKDIRLQVRLTPLKGQRSRLMAASDSGKPLDHDVSDLETVCSCFESASKSLEEAIELRSGFDAPDSFKADGNAAKKMGVILSKWKAVQAHCLTKFGTKLFAESACNRPDEISEKRTRLEELGITIG